MKTKPTFEWIENGGATSPKGFLASGVEAGLKANRTDMAMLLSAGACASAGLFTSNRMPAAPVLYDRKLEKGGTCRGVVVNVGCANAATGAAGYADCEETGRVAAAAAGIPVSQMFVCSTGTIGRRLAMPRVLARCSR